MKKYGSLPIYDSEEIIAVGDIHGEAHKLKGLINKIWKFLDNLKCHLVFCGDYFDRGVNSPKVFEILAELKERKPNQVFFVRGNHEEMVEVTIVGKQNWWLNWTEKTLEQMVSYWKLTTADEPYEIGEEFPALSEYWNWENEKYLDIVHKACEKKGFIRFLDSLIPYYENKDAICTHAPLDRHACDSYFERRNNKSKPLLDSLNVRWTFIKEKKGQFVIPNLNKFLICGHQYDYDSPDARIFNKRAFIDTGCGCKADRPLTAFRYPARKIIQEF